MDFLFNVFFFVSSFGERVFLPDSRLRHLLFRFAAGGDIIRRKSSKILSVAEKQEMLRIVKGYPQLECFLKSIDDGSVRLPKQFRNFVTSLSSSSPVCGYIHPTNAVAMLMNEMITGSDIKNNLDTWQQIHNNIPVIFDILANSNDVCVPMEMRPLLLELWQISIATFQGKLDDETIPEQVSMDEDELAFFPSLPTCRPRGMFPMDIKKASKTCNKKYNGHPSLLPGIFTIYCPHGKDLLSDNIWTVSIDKFICYLHDQIYLSDQYFCQAFEYCPWPVQVFSVM